MTVVLMALGLVLAVEGLVLALAPTHMRAVLEMLASLSDDRRRLLGLSAVAVGVALVWLTRA